MAKVITLSRTFPAYHPRKGEPTYFVEKVWTAIGFDKCNSAIPANEASLNNEVYRFLRNDFKPKHHTIRAGKRWKDGDMASLRVWSGKPYNSPQIVIAPDVKLRVLDIEMPDHGKFIINGKTHEGFGFWDALAANDGLRLGELYDWFNKLPFSGQILIWNDTNLPY